MPFTKFRQVLQGLGTLYSTSTPSPYGMLVVGLCFPYGIYLCGLGIRNIYREKYVKVVEQDKELENQKLAIMKAVTPNRFVQPRPAINAPFLEQQARKMILQNQQQNKSE